MCLVVQLAQNQVSEDEQDAIKNYTSKFGAQSWRHTLIVCSYEKNVKPRLQFATLLRERANGLRAEIARYAGWDIASKVQCTTMQVLESGFSRYPAWLMEHSSSLDGTAEAGPLFFPLPQDALLPATLRSSSIDDSTGMAFSHSSRSTSTARLPNYIIALCCLFVTGGPLVALGIIIAGPPGCSVAVLANGLLWFVVGRLCKWDLFSFKSGE